MIFAVLFVIAFLIGLTAYLFTGKWLAATLISTGLFALNTLTDAQQSENAMFTLILGLPVVFFASLLGAYVVELRRGLNDEVELDQEISESDNSPELNESCEFNESPEPKKSTEQK